MIAPRTAVRIPPRRLEVVYVGWTLGKASNALMGAILSSSARRLDVVSSNDLFSIEVRRWWVKCGSKDMLGGG